MKSFQHIYHSGQLRAARLAVIATALTLLVLSVVSYFRIQKMRDISADVHKTHTIKLELEKLYSSLRAADGNVNSFLLSGDTIFYDKLTARRQDISQILTHLGELTLERKQQNQISILDSLIQSRDHIMQINLMLEGRDYDNNLLLISKTNERIDKLIDVISDAVENQANEQLSKRETFEKITPRLLLTFQIVIVVILFLAYRFIMQELRNKQALLQELNTKNTELNDHLVEIKRQKEFMETIQNASFNLIAVYDMNGRFISFNNKCEEQFGVAANEVIGKTFLEVFPGRSESPAYKDLQRALKGESVFTENYQALAPGKFFQSYTMPVRDKSDVLCGVVAIAHEITPIVNVANELSETNKALKQQKEFAETLLNASVDAICVFDRQLNFLAFNKTAIEIFGMTEDMKGRKITELYPRIVGSKTHHGLLRALEGEPTYKLKHQSVIVDRTFESFMIPLTNHEGVYAVMLIHHDITEFVAVTKELTLKNQELERSNGELEQFAFVASHDLQEPLRKIQTFTSLMENNQSDAEKRKGYIGKINQAATRMSDLIRNVLDFSKVRLVMPEFEIIDLNHVMHKLIQEFDMDLRERNAKIDVAHLPMVKGSFSQLTQLFSNLIENALKFTERTPHIVITTEIVTGTFFAAHNESCDFYKISFRDNGIGFDPKYKDHIFEVFKRLHSQSEYNGTGIGLAICKRIVTNHKGLISVSSEPGKGSIFSVYLPLIHNDVMEPFLMTEN